MEFLSLIGSCSEQPFVFEIVECEEPTCQSAWADLSVAIDWNGKQARRSITSKGEQAEHVG
ncbi:hypothetical protein [Microvirga yunnanensis]|uniref:hypothetical protein n=1 Tax=Microvirga yunnanensis TaxID=2953740 RepID=UPI0021C78549|nr:hypothetical protein [Microvirga sp. HBU65207]